MKPSSRIHLGWASIQRSCLASLCFVISACGATPRYENAFSTQHAIQGNAESIPASLDVTWRSVLEVMAQRGWLIQQADSQSGLILAHREMRDAEDSEISYALSATVTLVPVTDQLTKVIAAANQTTEAHMKEYVWWHLLWLIPIFPVGSEYTTVVVDRHTVHDPQLYADFFAAVKQKCDELTSLKATAK